MEVGIGGGHQRQTCGQARHGYAAISNIGSIAAAVAHPASPGAASTTGTALAVDGGMDGLRPR